MIFLSMDLWNFRQFHGEQSIEFASGMKKNVTVINGANGAGKTSLFTALNWCLYNEGIDGIGALVSKEETLNRDFGDVIEAKVRVWFEHQGTVFAAIRKVRERKIKRDVESADEENAQPSKYRNFILDRLPSDEGDFTLLVEKNNKMDSVPDPNLTIDNILPKNARQYFLFDGEKIEKLTRPDHDVEVKDAVRNILQLPSIERVCEHLAVVMKDSTKETRKQAHGNEEEHYKALAEAEKTRDEIVDEIRELETSLKATRKLKKELDIDLGKLAGIKHLVKRREELEDQLRVARDNNRTLKGNLRTALSSSYLIPAQNVVARGIQYLDEKKTKKQIPPPVQEAFIESILEAEKCICGNELSDGSAGRECVNKFIVECAEFSRTSQQLSDLLSDLRIIYNNSTNLSQSIVTNTAQILAFEENIEGLSRKIEDVHNELKDQPQGQAVELEQKRRNLERDERSISAELSEKDANLKGCSLFMKDIEKKLEKFAKSQKAAQKYLTFRHMIEKSLDVMKNVYEEFAGQKRQDIEKKLQDIFSSLIWKDCQFPIVRLTDDYILEVYDLYGSPAREELSAGERQVLSLSFIAAMAFTSGGRVPLVMDTPFGRLFSVHRKNIAKEIPNLTNQCIFFVQDEELRGEARNALEEKIGHEYNLDFDAGVTTIGGM